MATKVTYISTSLPSDEQNAAFDAAVAEVRAAIGSHPLVIGGERRRGGAAFTVANPANRDESLGTFADASATDVADAVAAARAAYPSWGATPYEERARILQHAADLIRERVMFLGAVVALEVGKNRVESVGEVEEGADLISYYADRLREQHAFRIEQASQTGEDANATVLRPYGVFGIISPFNFPSALSAGPIGAALVAGNTVVFKPAETTPWSGVLLVELLHEAGVPAGALDLPTRRPRHRQAPGGGGPGGGAAPPPGGPRHGEGSGGGEGRRRPRLPRPLGGGGGYLPPFRGGRGVPAPLNQGEGRKDPGHRPRPRRSRQGGERH